MVVIMNCPRCNAQLSFQQNRCKNCGQDLRNYRRVLSASNICYNQGLAQAKVRDLSGAETSLRRSLKFNKLNTDARNLLGLIYYEEGEIVAALSEWVISKHFQDADNEADRYIQMVQSNPNKLENHSQTVKKFNLALSSAKNGDDDMAVIQLKKVVAMNPKFVRAHQLLALLYMRSGKRENRVKAYRLMKSASQVDVTNTTTLRYLQELSDVHTKGEDAPVKVQERRDPGVRKTLPRVDDTAYQPITLYKEEKPSVLPFVHVLLGVIIGIVVMQFLISPAIHQYSNNKENNDFKKYSQDLASGESDVTSLKNENEDLKAQVDTLTQKVADLQGGGPTDLAAMQEIYDNLIAAMQYNMSDEPLSAARALNKVKEDSLEDQKTLKLYKRLKKETFPAASVYYFEQGRDCYNGENDYVGKKDYDKAIKLLNKALKYDADNTDAMYFLGRCYQQKAQQENDSAQNETAKEYYNQIVNDYPDSERVNDASSRLRELGE